MRGEAAAVTSARMEGRSERRSRAKWEANWTLGVGTSSSMTREVAVVSQTPGS